VATGSPGKAAWLSSWSPTDCALGCLRAPGIFDGNLGLADQLAGLQWVGDNIAASSHEPNAYH